jgi:hypothetical protein
VEWERSQPRLLEKVGAKGCRRALAFFVQNKTYALAQAAHWCAFGFDCIDSLPATIARFFVRGTANPLLLDFASDDKTWLQ